VSTIDRGRTWRDRVPGGPWDTHELAIHRKAPDTLRVSAGNGYFESDDAGATWRSPRADLEVGYLQSVAIDPEQPEVVMVSASSGPYSAYVAAFSLRAAVLFDEKRQAPIEDIALRTGGARPPSDVMVAFIDQHRDTYGVQPIAVKLHQPATGSAWWTYGC
jgi:hypothetical protein